MKRVRVGLFAIVAAIVLSGALIAIQTAKLTVGDGIAADELGGTPGATAGGPNVGIDGNLAVVAASFAGPYAGKVYAFQRSGNTWVMQAELPRPADPGFSDTAQLGHSVGISGDRIIVGAPFPTSTPGRAWVYRNAGAGVWAVEQELVAPDVIAGDEFGVSVAIFGDLAIVGARGDDRDRSGGAAHIFRWDGAGWVFEARLKADDSLLGDDFGNTVAIDVDRAVVGAIYHPAGANSGAAYVFERAGTWTQAAKLTASDGAAFDQFSRSVAIEGDRIVVGAPQNEVTLFNQGAAYLYVRDGSWSQQALLTASDASANAEFGYSVSIASDLIAVGARSDQGTGSVYVFQTTGSGAGEVLKQRADDAAAEDRYGDSIALSGNTLVVSAPLTDDQAAEAGAAYFAEVMDLGNDGDACSGGDECVSGNCADGVCCDMPCGDDPNDCQACSVAAGAPADGTCSLLPEAFECRPASSACDIAELCPGDSVTCPDDAADPIANCCLSDADCNDDDVCTEDSCDGNNQCVFTPIEGCREPAGGGCGSCKVSSQVRPTVVSWLCVLGLLALWRVGRRRLR